MDWNALEKKFDKDKVLCYLLDFPKQLKQGMECGKKFALMENVVISKVVFCGMGGSGIGGKIIKDIIEKEVNFPIQTVSDYELPGFVDSNTLVVAVSFSGNTEETVACLEEAEKKGAKTLIIASGGKLAKNEKNLIKIPKAPQPRMALALLATPLFFVLSNYNLIASKEKEIMECADFLEKEKESLQKEAQKLAVKLKNKFPIVYAPTEFGALAYRVRCEFNENAKLLALHNVLPEMNHNEINAEILPKNSFFILLRNLKESEKIKKRFEFTKNVFKKYGQQEIWLRGSNSIEENFYGVFFAQLTAYYLALLNKKDPTVIPVIGELKKTLKEKTVKPKKK
ncbi:MAG: bifunctional phosphoglucose/phosphomannose isomerase [Candidatus Diapherotrites archaeon]|nr:bifunctional phosphoglucose/phosphomannose isomerase [Candidatus Diapherotrites archaeon]